MLNDFDGSISAITVNQMFWAKVQHFTGNECIAALP
jgi:hypothetical protein